MESSSQFLEVRHLGCVPYLPTYQAMQEFTVERGLKPSSNERDQLWICEHFPVFTQGLAGKAEHVFLPAAIPIVQTDRGGQVTYHGPGQVVAYPLMDLKRAGYFVKEYVYRLEEAAIRTLLYFGITGHRVAGAPGIYVRLDDPAGHAPLDQRPQKRPANPVAPTTAPDFVGLGKIAALGIKVSRNCTYHGVALNVTMDLEPYSRINPCGYAQLKTVDLSLLGIQVGWDEVAKVFSDKLLAYLSP